MGERRASSAASVENKEGKEHPRSLCEFEQMPLCCTAAALKESSELFFIMVSVHENTSMPPQFLDSKVIIQDKQQEQDNRSESQ